MPTDMLTELWQKHLGPYLDPLWSSVYLWRTLALLLLTAIAGLVVFRNRIIALISRNKILEHDKNIFTKANSLFPERRWIDFCNLLLSDHSYWFHEMRPLDNIVHFYNEKQNRYINRKLNLAVDNLLVAINKLRGFVSVRFFVFPEGQMGDNLRLCMQPEFNIDRGMGPNQEKMKKYDEWTDELEKIVNEAMSKYDSYRLLIKNILLI